MSESMCCFIGDGYQIGPLFVPEGDGKIMELYLGPYTCQHRPGHRRARAVERKMGLCLNFGACGSVPHVRVPKAPCGSVWTCGRRAVGRADPCGLMGFMTVLDGRCDDSKD